MARAATDWLLDTMVDSSGRLQSVYYSDLGPRGNSCLDDYAFTIEALLALASHIDWLEPGASEHYISCAKRLMDVAIGHFRDDKMPGFSSSQMTTRS